MILKVGGQLAAYFCMAGEGCSLPNPQKYLAASKQVYNAVMPFDKQVLAAGKNAGSRSRP